MDTPLEQIGQIGIVPVIIVRGGERVGIYFLEKGASQRPGKVIYGRVQR